MPVSVGTSLIGAPEAAKHSNHGSSGVPGVVNEHSKLKLAKSACHGGAWAPSHARRRPRRPCTRCCGTGRS
eukprot:scaffold87522_cov75-Phaeocystis_antarctica.AAC.2